MLPLLCNSSEALTITTPDGTKIVIRINRIMHDQVELDIDAPQSLLVLHSEQATPSFHFF
jgi:sRNA-binding carbon storage regulator CsrA